MKTINTGPNYEQERARKIKEMNERITHLIIAVFVSFITSILVTLLILRANGIDLSLVKSKAEQVSVEESADQESSDSSGS